MTDIAKIDPTGMQKKKGPGARCLKYKQLSKKTRVKSMNIHGKSSTVRYEHHAVPEVKQGMEDLYFSMVKEATGVTNELLGQHLIAQAQRASPFGKQLDVAAEAVAAALFEMNPQDVIEGMLAVQMTALHNQMMHCMRQSLENEWEQELLSVRLTKLNRHFIYTLHTFIKYRNRGQQRIVVENVTVSDGGKAIIGHVEPKLTSSEKN